MVEEIKFDDVEMFDLEEAKKLLTNIRMLADLRKFPIPKPQSEFGEMGTMQEWVKWYHEQIEYEFGVGIESKVLVVVHYLDEHLRLMVGRVEEGYRKMLGVADRRGKIIENYKKFLEKKNEQVITLQAKLEEKKIIVKETKKTEPPKEEPKKQDTEENKETKPSIDDIEISLDTRKK